LNVERFIPYLNSWTVEAPLQNASYKTLPVIVIGYPLLYPLIGYYPKYYNLL